MIGVVLLGVFRTMNGLLEIVGGHVEDVDQSWVPLNIPKDNRRSMYGFKVARV